MRTGNSPAAAAGMISRRRFLQQTGGLTFCFAFARFFGSGDTYAATLAPHRKLAPLEFNGLIQQRNFHDYSVIRMAAAPSVHVQLPHSDRAPSGVGETGSILAPATVANAFAVLTGKRLHQMPFTANRIRRVLHS